MMKFNAPFRSYQKVLVRTAILSDKLFFSQKMIAIL